VAKTRTTALLMHEATGLLVPGEVGVVRVVFPIKI